MSNMRDMRDIITKGYKNITLYNNIALYNYMAEGYKNIALYEKYYGIKNMINMRI